jgi:hydrogenase expression/formation protein HypD
VTKTDGGPGTSAGAPTEGERGRVMDQSRFSSAPEAKALVERIHALVDGPVSLMEVCGTHTVAISRYGLRSLMPRDLRLLSGPGCPVCVTPQSEIDRAVEIARVPGATVATFGDMMRVPGSGSSLEREKAAGADVRIVYSPLDAIDIAAGNPEREVVFLGVGFETTSPTIAATVLAAAERGTRNLSVLPLFKLVPPALHMLAEVPGRHLDGFICPGHVSTIIGTDAYEPVASRRNIPCVVVGFEPLDILAGIVMLLEQVKAVRAGGAAVVANEYGRAVTRSGNRRAQEILARVFDVCDSEWREIGTIPASGYEFACEFRSYDARERFDVRPGSDAGPSGCICGEIMLGTRLPVDCPLFGGRCVPGDPVGPCMVSSEGACAAFYKYERR